MLWHTHTVTSIHTYSIPVPIERRFKQTEKITTEKLKKYFYFRREKLMKKKYNQNKIGKSNKQTSQFWCEYVPNNDCQSIYQLCHRCLLLYQNPRYPAGNWTFYIRTKCGHKHFALHSHMDETQNWLLISNLEECGCFFVRVWVFGFRFEEKKINAIGIATDTNQNEKLKTNGNQLLI